jgi:hypothetical protein
MAERRRPVTDLPSALPYLDLIIGGSLLIPLGFGNVWFSSEMLAGRETYDPLIWLGWAMLVGGTGVLIALRRRTARRRRALQDALARLAPAIGAGRLSDFDEAVEWMNRYWPASHANEDLFRGKIHCALAGRLRRYPVLVDVEPDGYASDNADIDPRVLLYVAAIAPQTLPPGDEIAALSAAIRSAGFEPELLPEAGWRARANRRTVKRLGRAPGELADLAPVMNDLARLAEVCGAAPAPSA